MEIAISSPAKLNLFLKVVGKRPDGFHEISSLMQPLALADEITLSVSAGDSITMECSPVGLVPSDAGNLAWRAAEAFLLKAGLKRSVHIKLVKRIPVAAGLGGGSSNAAAVLTGLSRALGALPGEDDLPEIAASIGSDVPFFLSAVAALATGRGENIRPMTLPRYSYILINPAFPVSAAWAYANLDLTKKSEDNTLVYSDYSELRPEEMAALLFNDLEGPVEREFPQVGRLKALLAGSGAFGSLMSGSGPTVFGLYRDEASAASAFELLKGELKAGGRMGQGASIFLTSGL